MMMIKMILKTLMSNDSRDNNKKLSFKKCAHIAPCPKACISQCLFGPLHISHAV